MNNKNTRQIRTKLRASNGQALLEGISATLLVIMGIVFFVGLLLNVGFSAYYKERMGFVVDQTARYAGTLPGDDPAFDQRKTIEYATNMLNKIGVDAKNLKVVVKPMTCGGEDATSVEISADLPVCQQLQGMFPNKFTLKERSVSMSDGLRIAGYLRFKTPDETGSGMAFDKKVNSMSTDMTIAGPNSLGMPAQAAKAGILVPIVKPRGLHASIGGNFSGNLNKPTLNAVSTSDKGTKKQIKASQDVGSQTTGNFPGSSGNF